MSTGKYMHTLNHSNSLLTKVLHLTGNKDQHTNVGQKDKQNATIITNSKRKKKNMAMASIKQSILNSSAVCT